MEWINYTLVLIFLILFLVKLKEVFCYFDVYKSLDIPPEAICNLQKHTREIPQSYVTATLRKTRIQAIVISVCFIVAMGGAILFEFYFSESDYRIVSILSALFLLVGSLMTIWILYFRDYLELKKTDDIFETKGYVTKIIPHKGIASALYLYTVNLIIVYYDFLDNKQKIFRGSFPINCTDFPLTEGTYINILVRMHHNTIKFFDIYKSTDA